MYKVAVPTYDRVETCKDKTLNMLKRQKVPAACITLFVANKAEERKYVAGIPRSLYGNIVVGRLGLLSQLEFIRRYYPEGTHLVIMNDDIVSIFSKDHKKEEDIPRSVFNETTDIHLDKWIKYGFRVVAEYGFRLWGFNKTSNPYFMTDGYSTDLRLIEGVFFGVINSHSTKYKYKVNTASNYTTDDIERTILYYKTDGGVVRFNEVGYYTKWNAEGGTNTYIGSTETRIRKTLQSNRDMARTYPEYGHLVENDKQKEVFELYRTPHI